MLATVPGTGVRHSRSRKRRNQTVSLGTLTSHAGTCATTAAAALKACAARKPVHSATCESPKLQYSVLQDLGSGQTCQQRSCLVCNTASSRIVNW